MGIKVMDGRLKPKKESTFGKKPFKGKQKNRTGNKKVTVARIKPKPSAKNVKKLSSEDEAYLEYLQELDAVCFVCGKKNGIEWHHVKLYSSDKKNHKRLIPLCGVEHHRLGMELSAHGTPKKWRETYSMDEQNAYADEIYNKYKEGLL